MTLRGTTWTATLTVALACSTFGCSVLFTNGPKSEAAPGQAAVPPDCSTSRIPPIADTTLATFQAVRTGLAFGASDSAYDDSPLSREVDIGLGITLVAVYAASAVYGFYTTGACDEAERKFAARRPMRLQRAPAAPEPTEPPAQ
jgi:hypothetical protein